MFKPLPALLVAATIYFGHVGAQVAWVANQKNTTMCTWEQLRAVVVQDTVFLDGGRLNWIPGLTDNNLGNLTLDDNPDNIMWTLNFSTPFDVTQNVTALMGHYPKRGGTTPNYVDGALLANDYAMLLFGGLQPGPTNFPPVRHDQALLVQVYQNPDNALSKTGIAHDVGTGNVSNYISYGGAASAPSEQMGWYFGGLTSSTDSPLYDGGAVPNVTSDHLLSLNMSTEQNIQWHNGELPKNIKSRANPEVVWVPVGSKGILVVIGGVDHPTWLTRGGVVSTVQNETQSLGYLTTIDIYDIGSDSWYQQKTTGGPDKQLARGCAVVAPAQDFSSFNIYYYGGYSAVNRSSLYSDDVWVLSLPSFTWKKVYQGNPDHGRAGHKCVMPYPNQMMVIGGYTNPDKLCVDGIVQLFNLSSAQWMTKYDPTRYWNYSIPDSVVEAIGGTNTGKATLTTPYSGGWDNPSLASVFSSTYPTSRITTHYPYPPNITGNNTNPTMTPNPSPDNGGGGGGLPSWAPIVLGVVLGLVFITCVAVGILIWRRRKFLRRSGASQPETEDTRRGRVRSWLRAQPPDRPDTTKAPPTVDTYEAPTFEMESNAGYSTGHQAGHYAGQVDHAGPSMAAEMDAPVTFAAELEGTSPPVAELHNGLTQPPLEGYYAGPREADQEGHFSQTSAATTAGMAVGSATGSGIHREAAPRHIAIHEHSEPPRGTAGQGAADRPSSPPSAGHVVSGLSNISDNQLAHLRHLSDTSVSSIQSGGGRVSGMSPRAVTSVPAPAPDQVTPGSPSPAGSPGLMGPISPPSAGPRDGIDYLSAQPPRSTSNGNELHDGPMRRSAFHEHNGEPR